MSRGSRLLLWALVGASVAGEGLLALNGTDWLRLPRPENGQRTDFRWQGQHANGMKFFTFTVPPNSVAAVASVTGPAQVGLGMSFKTLPYMFYSSKQLVAMSPVAGLWSLSIYPGKANSGDAATLTTSFDLSVHVLACPAGFFGTDCKTPVTRVGANSPVRANISVASPVALFQTPVLAATDAVILTFDESQIPLVLQVCAQLDAVPVLGEGQCHTTTTTTTVNGSGVSSVNNTLQFDLPTSTASAAARELYFTVSGHSLNSSSGTGLPLEFHFSVAELSCGGGRTGVFPLCSDSVEPSDVTVTHDADAFNDSPFVTHGPLPDSVESGNEVRVLPESMTYSFDRPVRPGTVCAVNSSSTVCDRRHWHSFEVPASAAFSQYLSLTVTEANTTSPAAASLDEYSVGLLAPQHTDLSQSVPVKLLDRFYLVAPPPGSWMLAVNHMASANGTSQFGAVSEDLRFRVEVRVERCPKGCNGRGECRVEFLGRVPLGTCSCFPRFGGFACEYEVISKAFYVVQVLLLVTSNFAMIPALRVAAATGRPLEFVVFALGMVLSTLYHACDTGAACFGLHYKTLQQGDFVFSWLMILLTVFNLANLPLAVKASLSAVSFGMVLLLWSEGLLFGSAALITAAPFITVVVLALRWRLARRTISKSHGYVHLGSERGGGQEEEMPVESPGSVKKSCSWSTPCKHLKKRELAKGLLCLVLGVASNVAGNALNNLGWYWIFHSLWHVFIMLTPYFMLLACLPESPVYDLVIAPEEGPGPAHDDLASPLALDAGFDDFSESRQEPAAVDIEMVDLNPGEATSGA